MNEPTYKELSEQIKQLEKKVNSIENSQFHLSNLINNSPTTSMYAVDCNYRYTAFNDFHAANMIYLFDAEIEIGKSIVDYLPKSDRMKAESLLKKVLDGNQLVTIEEFGKENHRRFFELNGRPIEDKYGNILGAALYSHDVTAGSQKKKELQDSKDLLTAVIESPDDVIIFSLDSDFKYSSFNKAHKDSMKAIYDADIEIGVSPLDYITVPEDRIKAELNYKTAMSGENVEIVDVYGEKGNRIWFDIKYRPIFNEEKEVIGLTLFASNITDKKQKEIELQASKDLLTAVIESPDDMVILSLDKNYCYTSFNSKHAEEVKEIWGGDIELGKNSLNYITHKADRLKAKGYSDRALSGERFSVIEDYGDKNQRLWFKLIYNPIIGKDNEITGITVFITNITDQKESDEKLKRSEAFLAEAGKMAKVGGWEIDIKNDNKLNWTDETYRIYDLPLDHKLNVKEAINLFTPEFVPIITEAVNNAIEKGTPYDLDLQIKSAKGKIKWARTFCKPISEKGKVVRLLGVFQDITDRKNAAEKLIDSEKQYRELVETSQDLIWKCDAEGKFTYLNPAWENSHGYKVKEMMNRPFTDFMRKDFIERDMTEFGRLIAGGFVKEFPSEHVSKDGDTIHLLFNAIPLFDNKGNIIGTQGTAVDVTERKRLERQLQVRQRMDFLGTLAGGIAHDFNNILVGIIGYIELLKLLGDLTPPQLECIQKAELSCERASKLIGKIQTLTKSTTARSETIDIYESTIEVFGIIRETTNRIIKKEINFEPGSYFVKAEPTELNQILLNLATNSAQAIEEKGAGAADFIKISAEICSIKEADVAKLPPGKYVHIQFEDSGVGMTDEVKEKAFDPLFTTKELSTNSGQGLGLAMVYNIVHRRYNGDVHIDSTPGEGTVIHIYLPKSRNPRKSFKEKNDEIRRGTETVFVIDDEEDILNIVDKTLSHYGYTVLKSQGGEKAVKIFHDNHTKIDLVILDLTMPHLSGKSVFEKLYKIDPKVKVVMSSGHNSSDINEDFLKLTKGSIKKPYNLDTLVTTVQSYLAD